jgi:hypothetical protein
MNVYPLILHFQVWLGCSYFDEIHEDHLTDDRGDAEQGQAVPHLDRGDYSLFKQLSAVNDDILSHL